MSESTDARAAVRDLIDRYSDAVTRRNFGDIAAMFTETAVWKAVAPFNLQFEGAAIVHGLGAAVGSFELFLQAALNGVIEIHGDRATARTTIYEMGRNAEMSFVQFGLYEDSMAKIDGQWRFTARIFHPVYRDDSELAGVGFALQLGGA